MSGLANSFEALGRHPDAFKLREEVLALCWTSPRTVDTQLRV
jgi:hypothetical protein